MDFKKFINNVFYYVTVPKCASCGKRMLKNEWALCTGCHTAYLDAKISDCSLCGKILSECDCSNNYLRSHFIKKLFKVYRYIPEEEPPSNQLIYRLKRENRRDIREFISNELINVIRNKKIDLSDLIITNVPRRKKSIKKYGFDHTAMIAKILAKKLSIEYVPLLKSLATRDQKQNKDRQERIANAKFDYLKSAPELKNKTVILFDDIVTTGASLGSAASLIHGLGAKKIVGLTIAIAYKDDYTPFKYTEN